MLLAVGGGALVLFVRGKPSGRKDLIKRVLVSAPEYNRRHARLFAGAPAGNKMREWVNKHAAECLTNLRRESPALKASKVSSWGKNQSHPGTGHPTAH